MFARQRKEWMDTLGDVELDFGELDAAIERSTQAQAIEPIAQSLTPRLRATYNDAAAEETGRLNQVKVQAGLVETPQDWYVGRAASANAMRSAALNLCAATAATTAMQLQAAVSATRDSLAQGIERGEALSQLTNRVREVFDGAEKWRAERIARTETMSAHHKGRLDADIESEIVVAKQLLVSDGACPLCQTIARRAPVVAINQPFAVIGSHEVYAGKQTPPLHPNCTCTYQEVLHPAISGEEVKLHRPLIDPTPEAEDMPSGVKPPPPKPTSGLGPPPEPIRPLPGFGVTANPVDPPPFPRISLAEADSRLSSTLSALTDDQLTAVKRYTGSSHDKINAMVRGQPVPASSLAYITETEKHLSAATNAGRAPEAFTVFRGLPSAKKVGFDFARLKPGDVVTEKGYASTSLDPKVALQFAKDAGPKKAILEIRVPKGSRGLYVESVSRTKGEHEWLTHKSPQYRVVEVQQDVTERLDGKDVKIHHKVIVELVS